MGVLKPTLLDKNNLLSNVGRSGSAGLVVKNTFLEMQDSAEGSAPPVAAPLLRARTAPAAPEQEKPAESTAGDATPRSVETDLAQDGPTLPSSPASTFVTDHLEPPCPLDDLGSAETLAAGEEGGEEDRPLPTGVDWGLKVRNTFLQYSWSERPAIRRSSSLPDLGRPDSPQLQLDVEPAGFSVAVQEEGTWDASAPQANFVHEALEVVSTATMDTLGQADSLSYVGTWQPWPQAPSSPTDFYVEPYFMREQVQFEAPGVPAWPAPFETYEGAAQFEPEYEQEQGPPSWTPSVERDLPANSASEHDAAAAHLEHELGPEPAASASGSLGLYSLGGGGRRRRRGSVAVHQAEVVVVPQARERAGRGRGLAADEHRVVEVLSEARRAYNEGRAGRVWELAQRDRDSSYTVQQAIERSAEAFLRAQDVQDWAGYEMALFDMQVLLSDLHGHVIDALKHPHANHVIKQCVQLLPTSHIGFVAAELRGHGVWAARHCYGCRTVLRLVRHCGSSTWAAAQAAEVIDEVLGHAGELCRDEFGKFVLEEFLDHGCPAHKSRVVAALRERLLRNAKHRHASALIEKAFKHCSAEEADSIVAELLGSRDTVQSLMRDQFGMYVLRDLAHSAQHSQKVLHNLLPLTSELQSSKQGRKLLEFLNQEGPSAYH